jgi:hypothetical protein
MGASAAWKLIRRLRARKPALCISADPKLTGDGRLIVKNLLERS